MRRKLGLMMMAALLVGALALSGCGGKPAAPAGQGTPAPAAGAQGTPAKGGTLVYAQHMPIKSMDSVNPQTYPASYEANFLVYSNLVTFDENLKIIPDLAESWTASPEGTRWAFKLRKGVEFHDGTPFNAAAVKFHIDRILDPKTGSPNRNLWVHIKSVETPDDSTVVLVTEKPFGAMLNYLAHGSGGIVSPAAVQKWGQEYPTHPVGTGPYRVTEFTPGVQVVLARNDKYFRNPPPLERIVLKPVAEAGARVAMLQTGEADVISDVPPEEAKRLESDGKVQLIRRPGLRTFFLEFNSKKPPFDDPKVREALNYAIDKESLVKNLFLGYATVLDSPAASTIQGYKSVKKFEYNPEKAKQLLTEAGWKPDGGVLKKNGQPLKFSINTAEGEYPKDIQVVEAIQNQLKQIGIETTIWKVEAASRWSYLRVPTSEAKYEALLFGFNPSNGDLGYHLNALFRSNADPAKAPTVWNLMWFSEPEVDRMLTEGDTAADQAKRAEIYGRVQERIVAGSPVAWLYAPDLLVAARKEVKGVYVWPTIFTVLRTASK